MKRILYLILLMVAFVALPGCTIYEKNSDKSSEKITDPEKIEQLRTRGGEPKAVLNPFHRISVKTFVADFKRLIAEKDKSFQEVVSPGYSFGFTAYFMVALLIFLIILIVKVVRTFVISANKK